MSASKYLYSFYIQESVAFRKEIETQCSDDGDKAGRRGGEWVLGDSTEGSKLLLAVTVVVRSTLWVESSAPHCVGRAEAMNTFP